MLKLILLNLFFLSIIFNAYSQNTCRSNLPKRGENFGSLFGVSQQSKSTMMRPGEKTRYSIVVYKGFKYRVSLRSSKSIEGVCFRILSNNSTHDVLFDSSTLPIDNQEKIIDISNSCNLIIEVVFPKQELGTKYKKNKDECIGVLIEYYKKGKD